jgi:hypothetical protein
MSSTTGPDWQLYRQPYNTVDIQTVVIVINYASTGSIIVTNSDHNKTYDSFTVDPQGSTITTLDFPNVEDTYQITLVRSNVTLYTYSVTRPAFYLPPPTNTWTITPPLTTNPNATYTKQNLVDAISAAIAGVTIQVILIATMVAAVGAGLGAAFKSATKMLVPKDLLSIGVYAWIILDLFFNTSPVHFNKLWYIPFMIGYQIGFWLWHIPYIEPIRLDCAAKSGTTKPLVIYYPEDRASPAIMDQTNIALIKRWLGIHHYLGSDGPAVPDWYWSTKKPYWPKINTPALFVEKEEVISEEIKVLHFFTAHKFTTKWHLSNASLMPKYFWLQSSQAFFALQEKLQAFALALTDERLTHKARTTVAAAEMITRSIKVSPMEAIHDILSRGPSSPGEISDTGENTLTVVEAAGAQEQEGELETGPDSDRAYKDNKKSGSKSPDRSRKKTKREDDDDENQGD